jgi:hypothetical protein
VTPYQRVVRAARRGTGARLSALDVALLAGDPAIADAAARDDERETEVGRLLQERDDLHDRERAEDVRGMREAARRRVAEIDAALRDLGVES